MFHRLASMKKHKPSATGSWKRKKLRKVLGGDSIRSSIRRVADPVGGVEAARERIGLSLTRKIFPPVYLPGQAPWDV